MEIRVKNFTCFHRLCFQFFNYDVIIYAYRTHRIAASTTVLDDVTNYITQRIFNTS